MAISAKPYLLGLDLGIQSAGWSVIDLNDEGHPCGVRLSGVRCFDSGVGSETEIASGKDESQYNEDLKSENICAKKTPHTEALLGR